jgi:hypothetical protein
MDKLVLCQSNMCGIDESESRWSNSFFLVIFMSGCGTSEHVHDGRVNFLGLVFLLFFSFNLPFNFLAVEVVSLHRLFILD